MPDDLRVVFQRLGRKKIQTRLVGPAVRDALTTGVMDRVIRVDLISICRSLNEVEKTLDGVSTTRFFLARPERIRRSLSFPIQNAKTGEIIRRLVFIDTPHDEGLREELARREVTVNAVAMDGLGFVVDPFSGLDDLRRQEIRPVMNPATAFVQKPLNLVKIGKHIAFHGYSASATTIEWASKCCTNILDVPPERVRPELERLLVNLHPDRGLEYLQTTGTLRFLLPEVESMVGFADTCELHHKDIWEHTKKVVARSKPNMAVRWAALLHDIGKVWTRAVSRDGLVHFLRHEDMSALLFKGIAARFNLESRLAARIHFLITHHSRINMYSSEWTDSAVRRLLRDA